MNRELVPHICDLCKKEIKDNDLTVWIKEQETFVTCKMCKRMRIHKTLGEIFLELGKK